MDQLLTFLFCTLLAASVLLGFLSLFFAPRRTIWKALVLWGLGLGAGVALVPVTLGLWQVQALQRQADQAAGRQTSINDMHGFGEAMLALLGMCYFAGLLVLILFIFWISLRRAAHVPQSDGRAA